MWFNGKKKPTLGGYFAMSAAYQMKRATMLRLIMSCLELGTQAYWLQLAQLLPVSQPALLHRAVLIMNVTNIFRINASHFRIFHSG